MPIFLKKSGGRDWGNNGIPETKDGLLRVKGEGEARVLPPVLISVL